MAERIKNMKEYLILAGIDEINASGVQDFSIRRVAKACGVSCAAPYKHFRDKSDFIAAIIEYVNEQWKQRQNEILAVCGDSLREQIVEVSVGYVTFLMEKPYFRSILMLKNEEFDNIYHRVGDKLSLGQKLENDYFAQTGEDEKTRRRKLHNFRALLFGTVFLMHAGELKFNEETKANLRRALDREFDLD